MGYDGPLDGHLTGVSPTPVEIAHDGDLAEFDITPPEHRISLDDADVVEGGTERRLPAWRTAAPAGALALAGMVLSLLSLLGTHAATLAMQYREQVVYLNAAGATGRPSAKQLLDPFRHSVGVQLAVGAVAAVVSVAALLAARRRQECRRWVHELALAALLVAAVGLLLNGYVGHSIDTVKLPPASDSPGF